MFYNAFSLINPLAKIINQILEYLIKKRVKRVFLYLFLTYSKRVMRLLARCLSFMKDRKYLFFVQGILSLSHLLLAVDTIDERILICGVCKNVGSTLEKTIPLVESMGHLFKDYRVLIYENNSSDTTKELLKNWARLNQHVLIYSEDVSEEELAKTCVNLTIQGTFNRSELIARARNILLSKALSDGYKDYPYIIWFDLDFEEPFNQEAIIEIFTSKREWDAVFANSVDPNGRYFDWYAFRDKLRPIGPEVYGNSWWSKIKKETLTLNEKDDWYPVISAFGGLGIYKKSSIIGSSYQGIVTKDLEKRALNIILDPEYKKNPYVKHYLAEKNHLTHLIRILSPSSALPQLKTDDAIQIGKEPDGLIFRMNSGVCQYPSVCEHVPFHASMWANGHDKLFINPRLVLTYKERRSTKIPNKPTTFIWNKGLALLADASSHIFDIGFAKEDYVNIKEGNIVWVRTGHLPEFIKDVLPNVKCRFILVTGDGDESVPYFFKDQHEEVIRLLEDDRIIHWYTQNYDIDVQSEKLSPIPIGIDFHSLHFQKTFGEKKPISSAKQEKILANMIANLSPTKDRKCKVFAEFHLHDTARKGFNNHALRFGEDRKSIKKALENNPSITFLKKPISRTKLWKEKGKYAFSISPMGNGLDCHRTWEDLALGCIVIVKSSPIDSLFDGLPVVIVRDWKEITQENLDLWLKKYGDAFTNPLYREKLTNAYWFDKIANSAH